MSIVPLDLQRRCEQRWAARLGGKPARYAIPFRCHHLASKAIDSLTAEAPNNDETASRKLHLIKGPEEFREDRVDLPKAKAKK